MHVSFFDKQNGFILYINVLKWNVIIIIMLKKIKDNLFLKYGKNQHNGGAEMYCLKGSPRQSSQCCSSVVEAAEKTKML